MSGMATPAATLWLGARALPRAGPAAADGAAEPEVAAARPAAPLLPPLPATEARRAGCGSGCCAEPAAAALLPCSAAAEPDAAAPAYPALLPPVKPPLAFSMFIPVTNEGIIEAMQESWP